MELPPLVERLKQLEEEEEDLKRRGLFDQKYHYLGDEQWNYVRRLAALSCSGATLSRYEAYIDILQQIYNANSARRPAFTGGPDSYRSRKYVVNW